MRSFHFTRNKRNNVLGIIFNNRCDNFVNVFRFYVPVELKLIIIDEDCPRGLSYYGSR